MTRDPALRSIDAYDFRGVHPGLFLGTASDRYAGWLGQVYSAERYADRIAARRHTVGGRPFQEQVLPVECVREYFDHFRVLELDFTFYRPLLDAHGAPTQNFHLLGLYREHLGETGRLILKVPQEVFAQKLRRPGAYGENPHYLDPELFVRRFHEPATRLLGDRLAGFVFEQEYQRKQDRCPAARLAADLDRFFSSLPRDDRYHVELRTDGYLSPPVFDVLGKHGVGQVLSHWTWLPPLLRQFRLSGERFLNAGGRAVLRLLTPPGMRYEDAYARTHPFRELHEDLLDPRMVQETVEIIHSGLERHVEVQVIVNNRAGGNAPRIAQRIARRFLETPAPPLPSGS